MDRFTALCTLNNIGEGFEKVSISHASARWTQRRQDGIDDASSPTARRTCATQPKHEHDQRICQRHFTTATSRTYRTCGAYGRCQQGSRKDRRRVRSQVDSPNLFNLHLQSSVPLLHARFGVWPRSSRSFSSHILDSSLHISSVFVASAVSSCHDTPLLSESLCYFTRKHLICFLINMFGIAGPTYLLVDSFFRRAQQLRRKAGFYEHETLLGFLVACFILSKLGLDTAYAKNESFTFLSFPACT